MGMGHFGETLFDCDARKFDCYTMVELFHLVIPIGVQMLINLIHKGGFPNFILLLDVT